MAVAVSAVVKMSVAAVAMMTPAAVAVTPTVAVAPAPAVSAPAVGTPTADPAGLFDRALIVDDASRDARGHRRGLRGRQTRAGGENQSGGGRGRDNEAIHGKSSCCVGASLQLSVTSSRQAWPGGRHCRRGPRRRKRKTFATPEECGIRSERGLKSSFTRS